MTKKDLIRIIREVVRKEVKTTVQGEINEALNILENKKAQQPKKQSINKKFTKNKMLNEALNQTSGFDSSEWPEISQQEIRNKFAGMQGTTPQTDTNNRPVDTSKLDPSLKKALNRDYTELVKRF